MAARHTPGERRQSQPEPIEIAHDVAHPARVYDYVRGGDDNFTADREVADFAVAAGSGGFDHARAAVQANQVFHARAVTYLAGEAGIRQFLEIGAGIPTEENTHEIAQRIAPESRVVYADDDPVVLAHAHTLRKSASKGATAYVNANPRDPDTILRQAQDVLDLDQPIAIVIVALAAPHLRRGRPLQHRGPVREGRAVRQLSRDLPSDQRHHRQRGDRGCKTHQRATRLYPRSAHPRPDPPFPRRHRAPPAWPRPGRSLARSGQPTAPTRRLADALLRRRRPQTLTAGLEPGRTCAGRTSA